VRDYNYSAIRDNLEQAGICVSVPTIITRAKQQGYYLPKRQRQKMHDREVITSFIGELLQHDASVHKFSPYMDKLHLITTLDDHSRLLLYAELFERESTWHHIEAAQAVIRTYGCPRKYYVDQHSIFRFVRGRDQHSVWYDKHKHTDDIAPQWKQVLRECNIAVTYALSPQAKGKIERPYRWLQDRLVRKAAREQVTTLAGMRALLRSLVADYNHKWVHSTTGQIPYRRFTHADRQGMSLFTPLVLQTERQQTLSDVFCLRLQRRIDAYRKVSLNNHQIAVPNAVPGRTVDIKIIPHTQDKRLLLRFWDGDVFLGEQWHPQSLLSAVRF